MLGFISGLTKTVVKTAVGLPVAIVADTVTFGGLITDKKGHQSYSGDMLDSINDSLEEMTDD